MHLTEDDIDFIWKDVKARGITIDPLAENLVDHICCLIEKDNTKNFHESYNKALNSFGKGGLQEIEENTKLLLILKREITMKKLMFIIGYLATFIISYGIIARLLQPEGGGGGAFMFIGILILNFGFLPLTFYRQYKVMGSSIFMSILGYISSVLISTGVTILILHIGELQNPFLGGYVLASGMALFLLIFLPWYLVMSYKRITANTIPR